MIRLLEHQEADLQDMEFSRISRQAWQRHKESPDLGVIPRRVETRLEILVEDEDDPDLMDQPDYHFGSTILASPGNPSESWAEEYRNYRQLGNLLPPGGSPRQWPIMFCDHCDRRAVLWTTFTDPIRIHWTWTMCRTSPVVCLAHLPGNDDGWYRCQGTSLPLHRFLWTESTNGKTIYRQSPPLAFVSPRSRALFIFGGT